MANSKKTESFNDRSIEIIGEGITVEKSKVEKLGGENLSVSANRVL